MLVMQAIVSDDDNEESELNEESDEEEQVGSVKRKASNQAVIDDESESEEEDPPPSEAKGKQKGASKKKAEKPAAKKSKAVISDDSDNDIEIGMTMRLWSGHIIQSCCKKSPEKIVVWLRICCLGLLAVKATQTPWDTLSLIPVQAAKLCRNIGWRCLTTTEKLAGFQARC